MSEPNWAIVLKEFYDSDKGIVRTDDTGELPDDHWLMKNTDLSKDEVEKALDYLEHTGLAEYEGNARYFLLRTGFHVAHDRELKKQQENREDKRASRQHEVNRAVAFLTLGLVTVTALDSAVRALVGKNAYPEAFYPVLASLGAIAVFMFVLNRYGLLSRLDEK